MRRVFVAMILLAAIFSGCKKQDQLEQFHKFDTTVWERFDLVNFVFPLTDVKQSWNIYLVLRYNDDFQGRVLPLNIEMVTPSGDSRVRDYNLFLRSVNNDEITGEIKDGFYELKTLTHPQMSFSEAGNCAFEIENLNPKYFTPGVLEIGFILEPATK